VSTFRGELHRSLGELPLPVAKSVKAQQVIDRVLFTVMLRAGNEHALSLCSACPPSKLWERRWTDRFPSVQFLTATDAFVVKFTDGETRETSEGEVLDAWTGDVRLKIRRDEDAQSGWLQTSQNSVAVVEHCIPRADEGNRIRRLLEPICATVIRGWRGHGESFTRARVFDTRHGDEVFRIEMRNHTGVYLSPDGQSLIVLQDVDTEMPVNMLCFDIPRHVSWMRVAVVPLAACVLLIAWCTSRRLMRWRRERRLALASSRGAPPRSE
jgi:hypothetical protein